MVRVSKTIAVKSGPLQGNCSLYNPAQPLQSWGLGLELFCPGGVIMIYTAIAAGFNRCHVTPVMYVYSTRVYVNCARARLTYSHLKTCKKDMYVFRARM